ncbi:hypothetical protein LV476_05240 [Guyparkeria hydrothermalis]|uniref:hypothetical protein n=1 Tax=Guyparkeria hydrothermalis TaxID=923 RepID=UPI0020218E98|nr:hypothetical protein [Guyparkeria hydrothermalis]MCL7744356.1 hypothetical protein [Guyparkeria hydrothermalis]
MKKQTPTKRQGLQGSDNLEHSMPPFDLITSLVEGKPAKPAPGMTRAAVCRCPAHNDKRPSLLVSEREDGDILMHCRAGCSFFEVRDALGIDPVDLIPEHMRYARQKSPHKGPRFSAWQALQALAVDVIVVALCAAQIRRDGWIDDDDMRALTDAEGRIKATLKAGGFRV